MALLTGLISDFSLNLYFKKSTMSIFKSSNPTLQEKTYQGTILEGMSTGEEMTITGTMNKFGVLMALMIASTLFAWGQYVWRISISPVNDV